MAGTYNLELELSAIYSAAMPVFEIYEDGVLFNSYSISSAGSSLSVIINYGGALPSSLEFRFLNDGAEAGRSIQIENVKINNRHVNTNNYLTTDTITSGGSATVDVVNPVFLFDSTDPGAAIFTTGATQTFDGLNNDYFGRTVTTDEIFNMLGGRDVAYLGSGNDTVSGGDGNDIIRGGLGNDLLFGDVGDDRLYGEDGDDTLYGGDGNDRLQGDDGNDELHGGLGDDRLSGNDGDDIITGGDGNDVITGGLGDDFLFGDDGNDVITASSGNDSVDGGNGDDSLFAGSGNDVVNGGNGDDLILGHDGNDVLNGDAGNDIIDGGADNDILRGGSGVDILYGGSGIDDLDGGTGDDFLDGGTGNDTLDGGTGNDTIKGAANDDVIEGGTGHDVIYGDGGSGANGWIYKYYDLGTSPSTLATAGFTIDDQRFNSNTLTAHGFTRDINPTLIDAGDNYAVKYETYITITTAGSYQFRTSSDDGSMLFLDGVQIVNNDGAHGVVAVTSAPQTLRAGVYRLDATFFERTGGNVMDVFVSGPDTSGAFTNLDNYAGINAVAGAGDLSAGNDIINGGDGDDLIYGEGGNDTINGGNGSDRIFGGVGADIINGGGNNDSIFLANGDFAAGESINGGANTDNITFTNATTVDFRTGTVTAVENLLGSTGNDDVTYTVQQALGFSTINLAGGTDTSRVQFSGTYDATSLGTPTVTNTENGFLLGSAGADDLTLTGAQLNSLVFGSGIIDFGASTDALRINGTSSRLNTLGSTNTSIVGLETIDFSVTSSGSITVVLIGQNEDLTIIGSDDLGADNILAGNGNDTIFGGDGGDTITGRGGADNIFGEDGNDNIRLSNNDFGVGESIDGGNGTDTIILTNATTIDFRTGTVTNVENLVGSTGNDDVTYSIDQALDFDSIDLGAGTDNSRVNISGVLDVTALGTPTVTNAENGFLTGSGGADDLTISGTQLDALAYGGGAINFGGGTDILNLTSTSVNLNSLGSTSDSFVIGLEEIDTSAAGTDVTINLTAQTEGFTITGSNNAGGDNIQTGSGVDNIFAGAGNDTVNAGAGQDIIYGEAGNDTLSGGNDNDIVDGGVGNDTLNGDAGDDILKGGAGADTLNGGSGADVLYGNSLTQAQITTILSANPNISYNSGTNSFYQYVDTILDNDIALAAANATIVNGMAGSFATIMTQAENDYVLSLLGTGDGAWLSGIGDGEDSPWYHNSGPEIGAQFSFDSTAVGPFFQAWSGTDPNDTSNADQFLRIREANSGGWSDQSNGLSNGYVIEWHAGLMNDDNSIDTLNGGDGNDILYGYGGNDILNGDNDDDILFGGDGDDTLNGGNGVDALYGNAGNDTLNGGAGNDLLYGTDALDSIASSADNGVVNIFQDNFDTNDEGYTFTDDGFGNGNGAYTDGSRITTDGDAANGALEIRLGGVDATTVNNGMAAFYTETFNKGSGTSDIILRFSFRHIHDANFEANENSQVVFQIDGNPFTTVSNFAGDGNGGVDNDSGWVTVNVNLGNIATGNHNVLFAGILNQKTAADEEVFIRFDDVEWIEVESGTTQAFTNDISGGDGLDILYGSTETDNFIFDAATIFNNIDQIESFNLLENDSIDLTGILSGFNPVTDDISDFVRFTNSGSDTILSIDTDGTAGGVNFVDAVQLNGINDLDEFALLDSGNLVV